MIYRVLGVCLLAVALFTGCQEDKGPIEKAGEAVEDAADEVGDAAEDATEQ